MPRPTNKAQLIERSNQHFNMLTEFVDQLSDSEKHFVFPEYMMNRNIRDVLAHLHHWHTMMMEWYEKGMDGQKPDMPAKGYTWKTVPDLNRSIWEQYRDIDLIKVQFMLQTSFEKIQLIIQRHSDEELFEKGRYKWTGTTSLGAYLISATSSHYDWALKLIKKALKKRPIKMP